MKLFQGNYFLFLLLFLGFSLLIVFSLDEISYGKYGVGQTKWLSRARIGRFCLGVGFGSLLAKFI